MSLINQALKKEQQRRSLNLRDAPPDIPTYDSGNVGNGLSPSTRQSNRSLALLIGFTGVGAVLLLIGGGFIYFGKSYLKQINTTPIVAQETSEETAFASGPTEEAPVATVSDILEEIEEEKQALRPEQVPGDEVAASTSESDANDDPMAAEAAADSVTAEDETASNTDPADAPTEPVFDYKIQDLIDEMQVLGYRSAGVNSRLLMNGRVFKLNDTVNNEHGLRFIGSDGESLIFEAPSGYRYRKPL